MVLIITIGSVVTVILLQERTPKEVFTACVISNEENQFLVYRDSGAAANRLCVVATEKVPIKGPDNQSIPVESIKPKQMVTVTFGGLILMVWPSSYKTVYEIKVLTAQAKSSIMKVLRIVKGLILFFLHQNRNPGLPHKMPLLLAVDTISPSSEGFIL
ncbi:hypothetical protein [Acetanaerobacterium elongatum]|uniref:hypothetical protein n=1 Tax=Acetanaerobacterium elongatum TaxID=258515 RepID=UPI00115FBD85|nr:hypothetical protein [Acetanaerobacterium elongatum]